MSHFILLRQRIKIIESIKKTTSAMRLISMSLHSRLRNQKNTLETYVHTVHDMLKATPQPAPVTEMLPQTHMTLIMLIGSQKGLCGAFNEHLFSFFHAHQPPRNIPVITVGKYATDFIKKERLHLAHSFDQFGISNFISIAEQLKRICLATGGNILIISNTAPTFFSQRPHQTQYAIPAPSDDDFGSYLAGLAFKSKLIQILHESLLAEQAARFVAMDMAYQNAEEILNKTRLEYNKTRQAYVTRELIELSGGMLSQE